VIVLHQVVIDGLGGMHEMAGTTRLLPQQFERSGGVIAANIDEGAGI